MWTFKRISDWMNAGKLFTLQVVSYDRKRRTGGDVQYYEGRLVQANSDNARGRSLTQVERLQARLDDALPRDPQHRKWHTRNIRLYANGQPTGIIKKIHLPLIIQFNGEDVVP